MSVIVHPISDTTARAKKSVPVHSWDTDPSRMGQAFVKHQQRVALTIGKDRWTAREMITDLKCGNFKASSIASRVLKEFHVASVRDLASRVSVADLLRERGVGVTTIYVVMLAIEKVGGSQAPMRWLNDESHTIGTIKYRATHKDRKAKPKRRR